MDIDFRWGGDPNIVLAVEAALVASIPIQVRLSSVFIRWFAFHYKEFPKCWVLLVLLQLKDLQVFSIIRVIFQLAEEIPCISAVVVALLAEVNLVGGWVVGWGGVMIYFEFRNLPFTVLFVWVLLWASANQSENIRQLIDLKFDMHFFTSWLCGFNYFVFP